MTLFSRLINVSFQLILFSPQPRILIENDCIPDINKDKLSLFPSKNPGQLPLETFFERKPEFLISADLKISGRLFYMRSFDAFLNFHYVKFIRQKISGAPGF
jgi:hypothetical protein